MVIPRPSREELTRRIYDQLRLESGLTAPLEGGSFFGSIVKVIGAELDKLWGFLEDLTNQSSLTTATGAALDSWGWFLGAPRRRDRPASTEGLSRAVRISNVGSAPVNIPPGTRVYKSKDPQVSFYTTEGLQLGAGEQSDVHVVAADSGAFFNVGIGELDRCAFPSASLVVTNMLPIQNGSLTESDDSYRERLIQEFRRRDVLNRDNVVALARAVPTVQDVYLLDMARGAGTFDLVVIPYNPVDGPASVAEVQALLDENVPAGISAKAKLPRYLQLDVQVSLRLAQSAASSAEQIREGIRQQIAARIDNLPVENGSGNGTFYPAQVVGLANSGSSQVLDVVVSMGLDGSPLASSGEVRLAPGERILLRSLSVQ